MDYNKGDKFIFEISDAHTSLLENENYYSIKQAPYISFSEITLNKFEKIKEEKYRPSELEKIQQEAFEKGMEEAWDIAKRIVGCHEKGFEETKRNAVFDRCDAYDVFNLFKAKEAKEKIEAWEKESFNVGDVVEKDGVRGIVLEFDGGFVFVWTENRCAEGWVAEKVTKTDAHCDLMPVLEFIGKR